MTLRVPRFSKLLTGAGTPSESTPPPAQCRGLRRAEEGLSTDLGQGLTPPNEYLEWLTTLFPGTYTRALAPFHHEFWERIWRLRPDRSATEFYIWPRGFSKTTNAERAVIALAARGFKYILYVKETQEQANDAVQNIAAVLESAEVEAYYPLLSQRQVNKFGHSKGWKRDRLRTASGVIVDAAGLDVSIRGLLVEGARPDVIFLDDLDGKEDTLKTTQKKIRRITSDIVPAGAPNRVVIGLQNIINPHGVFTRLADLVPAHPADFLMDRFVSGPYPAVYGLEYEQSGVNEHGRPVYRITAGTSSWPEARPIPMLEEELNQMGPTMFIEEKQNEVGKLKGSLYSALDLKPVPRPYIQEFVDAVVVVDPAVTATDDSDSNGVRAGGRLPDGRIIGMYAWEGIDTVTNNLKRAFRQAMEIEASAIIIETNQGGDTWITTYRAVWRELVEDPEETRFTSRTRMPRMIQVKGSVGTGGKRERWQVALGGRERGEFLEANGTHETIFGALRRLPEHKPYDLADADAWLYLYLSGKHRPTEDDDEEGSVVTSNVT